jgi:hypothetical protein
MTSLSRIWPYNRMMRRRKCSNSRRQWRVERKRPETVKQAVTATLITMKTTSKTTTNVKAYHLPSSASLSPSCDPAIRSGCKRRLQHFDESVSTIRPTQQRNQEIGNEKEQEAHNSDSVYSNCSCSDQDSNDCKGPLPVKRRRPPPSSSHPTSKCSRKRRLQRPHISSLISWSKQAKAGLVLAQSSNNCAQS